jgi:RND family efflux transporter MFP subunit
VEAYPETTFTGFISEVSPVINPNTRMMDIIISLQQHDPRLKPGMFAKLKIITEKKNNIVKIPGDCLVKRYGENFVFVVKPDMTVEKRKVIPGIQIENKVEISDGLAPDEIVVIRGQTLLEDKTKIKIIEQIEPLSQNDVIE